MTYSLSSHPTLKILMEHVGHVILKYNTDVVPPPPPSAYYLGVPFFLTRLGAKLLDDIEWHTARTHSVTS